MSAPQRLTGSGQPPPELGNVGDRYTDEITGEIFTKRTTGSCALTGWTNRTQLVFNPTQRQKGAWVQAAQKAGMNLEQWVFKTLDAANAPPPEG